MIVNLSAERYMDLNKLPDYFYDYMQTGEVSSQKFGDFGEKLIYIKHK